MLYPKSKEKSLRDDLFKNPTSEYRAAPFWAWNCELDRDELCRQIEVFKQMGMGGAHMHSRTGMATPYLSDEFMSVINACVDKFRDENMLAWLYDEDRAPSGAAGGLVTKELKYRQRYLLFTTKPIDYDEKAPSRLLTCYDIVLDRNDCLKSGKIIDTDATATGVKWYAYLKLERPNSWYNGQTYINTLDPAAMKRFIEVTYERYYEKSGKNFGGVIPAIFTDEPQFTYKTQLAFARENKDVLLPWTDDLADTFKAAYDEDLLKGLPELLWELPDGKISTVRYHYHDHVCDRFTEAFADQCGKWCRDHGLMLTGHMMGEPSLRNQTQALGEAMRSYRSFGLPGIDMLFNYTEFQTAKQAQSTVRQYGREGMLSEMYGVTGWDFDFRGHKFQGDWQAALGVTVRVPHLSWVSMKGESKRDYPATINYQSPWWRDYSLVEDHFARLNTALTRGKPVVKVGVIHPIESYWLHWGPNDQTADTRVQLENHFQNLVRWLINGSIDFDFISESLLPEQCAKGGAPLQVGTMEYDTVIVPCCETLRSTTLERLEDFAKSGGYLIFLGDAPKYENAVPSTRGIKLYDRAGKTHCDRKSVLGACLPSRLVDIHNANGERTENLIHQLRADGDDLWLFIAHSQKPSDPDIPKPQEIKISLKGEYGVILYDTQTGTCAPIDSCLENGKTIIKTTIYDLDSLLLRFADRSSVKPQPAQVRPQTVTSIAVPKVVKYTLDEPNAYLLDRAEYALDGEDFHAEEELLRVDSEVRYRLGWPNPNGVQPWVVGKAAPDHVLRLRFKVCCKEDIPDIKLALEDADIAKITVNDKAINALPDGYFVDKAIGTIPVGNLKKGENVIEVELPVGKQSSVEWCYLLGDFGVNVYGEYRELTALQEFLGFDDITHQGLPHYSGNITYHIDVKTNGGDLSLTVPHYRGAAIKVQLDNQKGYIAYPPYNLKFESVTAGKHHLELTLLGTRHNAFGPVHLADNFEFIRPPVWRCKGDKWTDSYRLHPLGILSAPRIEEIK